MNECGTSCPGGDVILNDLVLSTRANQRWYSSGIDTEEKCLDLDHFRRYPFHIDYAYNSRGFRDREWPESQQDLREAIWCVGDSFTVGIGQPLTHTWPYLLERATQRRTINVSMDGASNEWIARRSRQIQCVVQPQHMILMWSYPNRRESVDHDSTDEDRRVWTDLHSSYLQDLENLQRCQKSLERTGYTKIIDFIVPNVFLNVPDPGLIWQDIRGPDWPLTCPRQLESLSDAIQHELKTHFKIWQDLHDAVNANQLLLDILARTLMVQQLDLSRDGHHFDRLTCQWIVDQICRRLVF